MIINGGSRCNRRWFTKHLTNETMNDRVSLCDVRGLTAENIGAAFYEMEAVASGTRCKNYFYHANLNPRDDELLTPAQWEQAVDTLEKNLGLEDHARFVVEHEKAGRIHRHVVWSRIDIENMRAVRMDNDYEQHQATARQLEEEFHLARGQSVLGPDCDGPRPERRPEQWEVHRGKRSGIDPAALKEEITQLWHTTDSGKAFVAALEERGYLLAPGDRRDFCIIDPAGHEHSLARRIQGAKAADIRKRMADIDRAALPSIEQAKAMQQERARESEAKRMADEEPPKQDAVPQPEEPPKTPSKDLSQRDFAVQIEQLNVQITAMQELQQIHEAYRAQLIREAEEARQAQQHEAAQDEPQSLETARKTEEERQDAIKKAEEQRQAGIKEDEQKKAEFQQEEQKKQDEIRKAEEQRQARVKDLSERDFTAQGEQVRAQILTMQQQQVARDAYFAQVTSEATEIRRARQLEGEIRDAQSRYGQALGQHYDIRDPYGSLARSAMAEHGAFLRDRENLSRQIAQTNDPAARQALELRQQIEAAEYMAITDRRIATQSEVIAGRPDTEFAKEHRARAEDFEMGARQLREQYRELQMTREREKTASPRAAENAAGQGVEKDSPAPLMVIDTRSPQPVRLTEFVNTLPPDNGQPRLAISREEYLSSPDARRAYAEQQLADHRRGRALDQISKDIAAGQPLNADDVRRLNQTDCEGIRTKGDEYLHEIVNQYNLINQQQHPKGPESEL